MLDKEELKQLGELYKKEKSNIVLNRMLNKVSLVDLITDKDTEFDSQFNININTHGVVDQRNSCRCWSFAALNILREEVIKKCDLDNFQLSGSYIAYYDKLERFNKKLENIVNYKLEGKDLYDRYISKVLSDGIYDGGWFTQFAYLVDKYGAVPSNVFPETYHSSNTYEINLILTRLLRKFYLEIEKEKDVSKIDEIKEKYFRYAYKIVSSVYGIPSEIFNFEYTDINGKYHIDKNLTPKKFYNKYIGLDLLNDYVEVGSYKDERYDYGNVYQFEDTAQMSGAEDLRVLVIKNKELKNLMLKQLRAGELVSFYCSTTARRIDGIWIDTMDRYSDIFDVDLRLDNNDILKTNGRTGEHCMLFSGVKTIANKPVKWKVENSWGSQSGFNGKYIADDDWVNKYVYIAIINKKHLNKKQEECLNKKIVKVKKWDAKLD